jgi:hypothetical protein
LKVIIPFKPVLSLEAYLADLAQVERGFQLHNDNLEASSPKVKKPREYSLPKHKIDSFSNWSSPLFPIVPNPNEIHEGEQLPESYTGPRDELLSGNPNPLRELEKMVIDSTKFYHGVYNQQTVDYSHIGGIQDMELIPSASHYVPCQDGYPCADEQHFVWELGIWDYKTGNLGSWNNMTDDPTVS